MPRPSIFFVDLWGTLLNRTSRGVQASLALQELLGKGVLGRVGILCNLPQGQGVGDVRAALASCGIEPHVDSRTIVVASALGAPLPDRRAFAAAAAMAEASMEECLFLSANQSLVIAAIAAGMRAARVDFSSEAGQEPIVSTSTEDAVLMAGEVDEDRSGTYILQGRIVTMQSPHEVIEDGRLLVSKGMIRAVLKPRESVPSGFADPPVINTHGTIYPGLMDLHNHFVYNVLPMWVVPKRYENRSQWPRHGQYKSSVSMPIKQVLARSSVLSAAVLRYVEAKALLAGTTTGQGILTNTKGGRKIFCGAMRNVEVTRDDRLPEAISNVGDMATGENGIEKFRKTLKSHVAFFYHLAEGVDDAARRHFLNLRDHDLVGPSLVGIHALALAPEDLEFMADRGAKIVWSPFSNLLLYGKTLDLRAVKDSGVQFSLGCDWSPTGSRNLLQELKVASFENRRQESPLTNFELVAAVTSQAACIAGWEKYLGTIKLRAMADLLILAGRQGDPFEQIIKATETDVRLVTVHGVPRYGTWDLVNAIVPEREGRIEDWRLSGERMAFYFHALGSPINDLTFAMAVETLKDAMNDLPGTRRQIEQGTLAADGMGVPEDLLLEMDNEPPWDDPFVEYDFEPQGAGLMADAVMVDSVSLDDPVVGMGDYWDLVNNQPNITSDLKGYLRDAY